MIQQFFAIFIDVVAPVFGVVLVSYVAGPRLDLKVQTLSRSAFYLLIPAFVFNIISRAEIQAGTAVRMIVYIAAVHMVLAAFGFLLGRALNRPRAVIGAYALIAVFGNTGNFGLSLINFRLGEIGLESATVYFLGLTVITFSVGVGVASWAGGRSKWGSLLSVFRTPALIAVVPAVLFNVADASVPLFLDRLIGLMAQAMIPVMLVTLGVQLAEAGRLRVTRDVFVASALRLVAGPIAAVLLILPFGLSGPERATGILQSSMPAGVMTALIAIEYNMAPEMVTHTVLFSTVMSFLTLTVMMLLV